MYFLTKFTFKQILFFCVQFLIFFSLYPSQKRDILLHDSPCLKVREGKTPDELVAFKALQEQWEVSDEKQDFYEKVYAYFSLLNAIKEEKRLSHKKANILFESVVQSFIDILHDQQDQLLACKMKLDSRLPQHENERSIQIKLNGDLEFEMAKVQELLTIVEALSKAKFSSQKSLLKLIVPCVSALVGCVSTLGVLWALRSKQK